MKTTELQDIIAFLESFAPIGLAEEWDNVGLLLGNRRAEIHRGLTCLTITPEVVAEAIEKEAGLLVSHHPLPFHPVKKITNATVTGRMILELIRNDIAVYSPHTAFDSTDRGINQMIAERLRLKQIQPLQLIPGWSTPDSESVVESGDEMSGGKNDMIYGVGRFGKLEPAITCRDLGRILSDSFQLPTIKFCGDLDSPARQVGIACGAAGQFLSDSLAVGCDVFITGETNFHTCLEALANHSGLFLLGHYGSERFAVELLAEHLAQQFPKLVIEASETEQDPVQYLYRMDDDQ